MNKRYVDYILILGVIIAASVALFFKIGNIPPLYPWSDESEIAADAVATLVDGPQLFYPGQLAGGSLAVWLESAWMLFFSRALLGLRILNSLVNIVTAVLLYLLVCKLPLNDADNRRFVALASTLLLAVSTWLLGMGRIATPNWSLVPLLTVLTFYTFWRGVYTNRRIYFVFCGLVMGLLFYGYLPGYFVPLTLALFVALLWLLKRFNLQSPISNPQSSTSNPPISQLPITNYQSPNPPISSLLLSFIIASITAAPILIFFVLNPVAALQRPLQLSNTNELTPSASPGPGLLDMLSTFGLYPNWLIAGRWEDLAFDPIVTILFVIGLVVAVWRWRQPAYLFLLVWWGVMIAPALLSRSASQGFIFEVWRRGIGAQPVSFIIAAVGLYAVVRLPKIWTKSQRSGRKEQTSSQVDSDRLLVRSFLYPLLVLAGVVLVSATMSYWLYFNRWANSEAIPALFAESPVRMVDWMERAGDEDTLFIFPLRPDVSPTTRPELFTVRYLYEGQADILFPEMREEDVAHLLARALAPHLGQQPGTVKLMMSERVIIDPKGYFTYALGHYGSAVAQESLPDYTVTTYRVYDQVSPSTATSEADIDFGGVLQLVEQDLPLNGVKAGWPLNVALVWQMLAETEADYNVNLTLYDGQGYAITTIDKPLLSTVDYETTRHWSVGEASRHYYPLLVPADTPPGEYTLQAAVYNTDTSQRLAPAGGQVDLSIPLAEIALESNPNSIDPATLAYSQPLAVTFPNSLRLWGMTHTAGPVNRPGDALWVTLWWQATEPLAEDVGLMLALSRPDEEPVLLFSQPQPLIDDYPVTEWPTETIYRANARLVLPATLESDDYHLALGLINPDSGEAVAEQLLFPLRIEARVHNYELPPLAQPANIEFGEAIRLQSFELEQEPELKVRVQWQALREMAQSYKIFLHLTDATGQIMGQMDTLPQQGLAPTTSWVSGEMILDELSPSLTNELTSEAHRLVIGLYNENTGERLVTSENLDYAVLFERLQ